MTLHEPGAPDEMHDCIIILWHIDDVRSVRPDLTDEQCREVLRRCEDKHNAEIGINWDVIRTVAEECFPKTGEAGQ